MDALFTLLRVGVSLGAVIALIWFIGRKVAARNGGLSRGRIRPVVRHGLGQRQSIQVLDIDTTRYVLGIAEQNISVLDSYPVPEDELPAEPAEPVVGAPDFQAQLNAAQRTHAAGQDSRRARRHNNAAMTATPGDPSPIAGSILSRQTWRQFFAVLRSGAPQ